MAVYFIRAGNDGPVKIGYAANVDKRLRALQTSHHEPLFVLRVVPGGKSVERWLHSHFSGRRLRSEWFDFDQEMLVVEPPHLDETSGAFPIIERLGGRHFVATELREIGRDRCDEALRKWHERKALPGWAIVSLMKLAERRKMPYRASDFCFSESTALPKDAAA